LAGRIRIGADFELDDAEIDRILDAPPAGIGV
jgi:hypothetical protein